MKMDGHYFDCSFRKDTLEMSEKERKRYTIQYTTYIHEIYRQFQTSCDLLQLNCLLLSNVGRVHVEETDAPDALDVLDQVDDLESLEPS